MRCSSLILLFLLFAIPATCFSWPAKVISVADGDTITVLHNDQKNEIRLNGIEGLQSSRREGFGKTQWLCRLGSEE